MPNTLLDGKIIASELLRLVIREIEGWGPALLVDDLRTARLGDTVMLRSPAPWVPIPNPDPWAITTRTEAVALNGVARFDFHVDLGDFSLSLDQFSRRYLLEANQVLANQIQYNWAFGAKLVTAPLEMPNPQMVKFAQRVSSPEDGLSLRLVGHHDILCDELIIRADVLFGFTHAARFAKRTPQLVALVKARTAAAGRLAEFERIHRPRAA